MLCGDFGGMFKTTTVDWVGQGDNSILNGIGDFRKLSVINNQYCFFVGEDEGRVFKKLKFPENTWDSIGYTGELINTLVIFQSEYRIGWRTFGEQDKSTDGSTWKRKHKRWYSIYWSDVFSKRFCRPGSGGNTKNFIQLPRGLTIKNENLYN